MADAESKKIDAETQSLLKQLTKSIPRISVLRETTDAINSALKTYGDAVKEETKAVNAADLEFRKARLNTERLRSSLGQFNDGIIATYKLQKAVIAEKQAEYTLAQAATAQAKALLDANGKALEAQNAKVDALKNELAPIKESIKQKQAERSAITESINSKKDEIAYTKAQIAKAKEEQAIIDARKSAIRQANEALTAEAVSSRNLEKSLKSQIALADIGIVESKGRVGALRENETAQKSQIDAINEDIRRLQKRGEFKGRGKQAEITKAEEEQIQALQERKEEILATLNYLKDARKTEIAYQQSIADRIPGMEAEMQAAADAATAYESAISKNNDTLEREGLARLQLSEDIVGMSSTVEKLTGEQEELDTQYKKLTEEISGLMSKGGKLNAELKVATDKQRKLTETQESLANAYADMAAATEAKRQELINTKIAAFSKVMSSIANAAKGVADVLQKIVGPILELQKQFGLSAGSAAKLKFENLMSAASSYTKALLTGAPAVGAKEIEATQGAFQAEFGGVLTSDAARGLAEEAKRLGVGASEMAKARRVFMTQTMGDTGKAKAAQDKFIGEFAKKGLTAKDAMMAIGQNSELLARNGTRFASSFARAAADAKKIGVDLSKIDQVGDNIIGNFEGFLESQAELGAMGFGFDSNRLAELAETGDTGALMDELRSQLASTGKDITKLRRSEQLALSQAFGLSMEELQRMAGPTAGSGEETLSPEELQKDANKSLGTLVNQAHAIIGILGTIVTIVGIMNSKMVLAVGRSVLNRITGSGVPVPPGTPPGGAVDKIKNLFGKGKAGPAGDTGSMIPPATPPSGTPGSMIPPATPPSGAPPGGGIKSFMNGLNPAKMLAGAGALLIVSAALFVTAKALHEFAKVEWSAMGKAGVALLGLVAVVAALGAIMMSGVGAVAILAGAGALAILSGSLMLIATALRIATPGLEAFGNMMKTIFSGVSEILTAAGAALATIFQSLAMVSPGQILALAVSLPLMTLGLGGLAIAVGLFPTTEFSRIASKFAEYAKAGSFAEGIRTMAAALTQLKSAVDSIDINKLSEISKAITPSITQRVTGAIQRIVSGVIGNNPTIAAGTPASAGGQQAAVTQAASAQTTGTVQPPLTQQQVSVDFTRLEQKLDAVVQAIASMRVEMDGVRVGKILVNNNETATSIGVFRQGARATL